MESNEEEDHHSIVDKHTKIYLRPAFEIDLADKRHSAALASVWLTVLNLPGSAVNVPKAFKDLAIADPIKALDMTNRRGGGGSYNGASCISLEIECTREFAIYQQLQARFSHLFLLTLITLPSQSQPHDIFQPLIKSIISSHRTPTRPS